MPDSRSAERRGGNPAARGAEAFSVGTPRVLVVEDSETIREMVSEALADAGYLTDTRPDGDKLEDVLDGFRPDLVVLDVMLPGRDGFALLDVILAGVRSVWCCSPRATACPTGCEASTAAPTITWSSRSNSPNWCPGWVRCCAGGGGCRPPCRSPI